MRSIVSFLFILSLSLFLSIPTFAQDFSFTKTKAKTGVAATYTAEVKEQRILHSIGQGETLELEFDGQQYFQTIKKRKKLNFGYTGVSGYPLNGKNSYSHLMIKDDKLSGILHFEGTPYRLSHENGAYQFFEISEEVHACGVDQMASVSAFMAKTTSPGGDYANPVYDLDQFSDTTTVDVLILYTSSAKAWAAGPNNSVTNDIDEIFALNESFKEDIIENSALPLKIRYLGYVEIDDPTASSTSDVLSNMADNTYAGSTHTSDTVDIHSLRDQFGADLVALVDSIQDTGGLGYVPDDIGGSPVYSHSVNRVQQLSFGYTLMHEIGHNFGNGHGRTQSSSAADKSGAMFQFSTGHYFEASDGNNYNTVMHYGDSNSSEIPYFSNPRVTYIDSASGTYNGAGAPADNALSMTLTKNWIADYRETVIDPPSLTLTTTSIADTVFPSGVSKRDIIIENTGNSDLEIKLDGEMAYSSSLKMRKTENIKQPLDIFYGFEESEGFDAGSYSAVNDWVTYDDTETFEITTSQAASGSQSLKIPSGSSSLYISSPYFANTSRYSTYNISMKIYSAGSYPRAFLSYYSPNEHRAAGVFLEQNDGYVGFYGNYSGSRYYRYFFSDVQLTNDWADVGIEITTENNGTVNYSYESIERTTTNVGYNIPARLEISLPSTSSYDIYVDDIHITAEDLYGPALTISDDRMTIRPGEKDTMSVTFYGNENDEGNYEGTIYLETNDPNNDSLTIPIDLRIDPNNLYSNGQFAIELTGEEGYRMLSAPTAINLKDFLEPLHTQGATNADVTNGGPNVWTWDETFAGSTNEGWTPVADLDTTIQTGDAFLVYVFDESVYGDSTSRGFPKLLSIEGASSLSTTTLGTGSINQNADGYTLIGNPFPSTVDWDDILANTGSNKLNNPVYAYDVNSGSWKSYSSGVGDLTNGLIKPFQAFFVQSSSTVSNDATLAFDSDDITTGGDFYGKSENLSYARFEVTSNQTGLTNSAYLLFDDGALSGKDPLDAVKMSPLAENYLLLSTMGENDLNFDINALPQFEQELSIPLKIQSNTSGTVQFSLTDTEGLSGVDFILRKGDWEQHIEPGKQIELDISAENSPQKNVFTLQNTGNKDNRYELILSKQQLVSIENPDVPTKFELLQNYPNPFNPSTSIQFGLPSARVVTVSVYNILGQQVALLVNEPMEAGFHTVKFEADQLSSGVYLFRLEAGEFVQTRKMLLMK
ncbi:zinc-dependent metalloprotease [Gracilimonas sp.]|uniref:zinc-dependent metalloprotease n=1 Tax=Gracilimonas sp. TaxID=1974203 RepID=UPI003D0C5BB5